jgi:surface protein
VKTQTFKIRKRFIPNFLVLSASAVLVLFGALLIASPVSTNTNAEDAPAADGISLVTSKTIEASIHPEENGTLSIVKDTVIGSTSSAYGYELYVSTSSTDDNDIYLNGNTENSEATKKISATTGTYDTPAALDITNGATWGYAVAGLGNFDASYNIYTPSNSSKFAAMPTIDNKQLIHESNIAIADDTLDIYYGIEADSTLEPGLYKTEILYTAVPKPEPPRTAKAVLGNNGNLSFVYDTAIYNAGGVYTDNLGEPTEIVAVYDVPTGYTNYDYRNLPAWHANKDVVTSVNFDQSFYEIKPVDTSYWFYNMKKIVSITNADNLNTSEVTNMSHMLDATGIYNNAETFTIDGINEWDVSKVTDMSYVLSSTGYFSDTTVIDISNWHVDNVTNMSAMFEGFGGGARTAVGIGDISGWNVSNVTDMSNMFRNYGSVAEEVDLGNLSGWDVGSVTDMTQMFSGAGGSDYEGATTFNVDVSGWDVSNVTKMQDMFNNAGGYATTWSIGDLSGWDVGSVETMTNMFYNAGNQAEVFDIGDLSEWDVSNVTTMDGMFEFAGAMADTFCLGDIGKWDVSSVVNMSSMFRAAGYSSTTWDIGELGYYDDDHPGWNVSNVTNMTLMFAEASAAGGSFYVGDISSWNVGSVETMQYMFRSAGNSSSFYLGDIGLWDVSSVNTMEGMFNNAGRNSTYWYIGNLGYVDDEHPGWDVSGVENMYEMFKNAGYRTGTWDIGDLSSWDTRSAKYMSYMFYDAGYNATTWNIGDISNWAVTGVSHQNFIRLNNRSSNASVVNNQPNW